MIQSLVILNIYNNIYVKYIKKKYIQIAYDESLLQLETVTSFTYFYSLHLYRENSRTLFNFFTNVENLKFLTETSSMSKEIIL